MDPKEMERNWENLVDKQPEDYDEQEQARINAEHQQVEQAELDEIFSHAALYSRHSARIGKI